jgi:hypothetical protein
MMTASMRDYLVGRLWPDGGGLKSPQVHWLLDGARHPDIADLVTAGKLEYACLYAGPLHPRLRAAAPYLVHLAAGSPGTEVLLERGWGKAWGILLVGPADVSLTQLRLHCKKLLRVQTEVGESLAFRFYDPRVLTTYLPTCTDDELARFFGPITRVVAENESGHAVVFDAARVRPRPEKSPLVIRAEQCDVFVAAQRLRFENRCVKFVLDEWAAGQSEAQVRTDVRALLADAEGWGFETERDCYRLVNVAAFLGLGFQWQAQHGAALGILADTGASPAHRLASLISYATRYRTL